MLGHQMLNVARNGVQNSACTSRAAICWQQTRQITQIPKWEYHIRMDSRVGRKMPSRDVLERFKRLDNGMWIRHQRNVYKLRYMKDDQWKYDSLQMYTCSKEECEILDAMMTPFHLRKKNYINDPYKPYQTRRGLSSPRMDNWNKTMVRERGRVLLDDTTIDTHFHSR